MPDLGIGLRERMIPAPFLPPVLGRAAVVATDTSLVQEVSALSRTAADEAFVGRAVAVLQAFADAHAGHVQALTELHQQFLALQRTAETRIVAVSAAPRPLPRPVAPPLPIAATAPPKPGPKLSRAEIEALSSGARTISSVFGPAFARQDSHRYQLRIPTPPLTIIDRVTGIDGEPGSMKSGTLWAETDITADSWGLDPTGHVSRIVIGESSQGNVLLASWLGADLAHDGDHRYRLLDSDTVILGPLPRIGDTMCLAITLERQALIGGLRLFFFTAEIRVRGALRSRGRFSTGMFTDEELSRPEEVKWDATLDTRVLEGPFELPGGYDAPRSFSRDALKSIRDGRVFDGFGPGFERILTHVRTPGIAKDELFLLDQVQAFEPTGGPWGRGYLRATQILSPDDWFFASHFPGDPCLPGFLLVEGACQALSFYLTALGLTLARDGWRFEPLLDRHYVCKFRGQITPQATDLTYEVFVESLVAGPQPHVVADVICRIHGRTIFHARRIGLGLVPDWPMEQFRLNPYSETMRGRTGPLPALGGLAGYRNTGAAAAIVDGEVACDYPSILALAWGKAQEVLGSKRADYDGPLRWPRIPSPPFLFATRILRIDAEASVPRPGSQIESAYEIGADSWYFGQNGVETMPFAVLLEAALQPCGWFMFYVAPPGATLDRALRNLDGTGIFYEALPKGPAILRVEIELVSSANLGGTTLYTFKLRGYVDTRCICEVHTSFGIFPPEALIEQAGVPVTPDERIRIVSPGDFQLDLTSHPARYFSGSLRLPEDMLLMIQRVTALDPAGGRAGLGWIRGEKDVDPGEWFFKSHFFQDPVQPGSLGLEAFLQLLQVFMIERGLDAGVPDARFEPILLGRPMTWKYRGQVLPENKRILTEVEIGEIGRDEKGPFVIAQAWLWVDGIRIYHAMDIGMRIVSGSGVPSA